MPNIKNILIFVAIAAAVISVYFFFIKGAPEETTNLVSTIPTMPDGVASNPNTAATTLVPGDNSAVAREFLTLLLSVKSIKLDDAIFSDNAFLSLRDSTIVLIPDGNEGRPNPFAPIGTDPATILPLTCVLPKILDTATGTCITPPPVCTLPQVLNVATNTCVTVATCVLPKVLNPSTNTCVVPVVCVLPKVRNTTTNTCVTVPTCVLPQVLDTSTNTCINPPAH